MAISSIGRTQAAAGGFIPSYWAQKALSVLRNNIVLARVVSRDYEFGNFTKGQTLNIPYPGTFTAQQKTEGNPATVQQPTNSATVAVTLSQHWYVDFVIEDWAQAQADSNLMMRYMEPAIISLAENLENYLFSFYTGLTLPSVGTSGTPIVRSTITAAREALNTGKVPLQNRSLIINPASEQSLLTDSTLQSYFAFARSQGVSEGSIGRIDGFDIYMSQLVPIVSGTPNSTKNLAIHKEAFLLAVRPLPEINDAGVKMAVVHDPESGLAIRMQYQYRSDYRGMYVGFDILYGGVVLRPGNGLVALG